MRTQSYQISNISCSIIRSIINCDWNFIISSPKNFNQKFPPIFPGFTLYRFYDVQSINSEVCQDDALGMNGVEWGHEMGQFILWPVVNGISTLSWSLFTLRIIIFDLNCESTWFGRKLWSKTKIPERTFYIGFRSTWWKNWSHDFRGVWTEPFDTTVKISFVRQNAFWNVFNEFHFYFERLHARKFHFWFEYFKNSRSIRTREHSLMAELESRTNWLRLHKPLLFDRISCQRDIFMSH